MGNHSTRLSEAKASPPAEPNFQLIAVSIDVPYIRGLFEDFKFYAKEKRALDENDFVTMMKDSDVSERKALAVFRVFDADRNGEISFDEFVYASAMKRNGEPEGKLVLVFRLFDVNGDGFLTRGEVSSVLEVIGKIASEEKIDGIFRCLDSNQDSLISQEEFVKEGMKYPQIIAALT